MSVLEFVFMYIHRVYISTHKHIIFKLFNMFRFWQDKKYMKKILFFFFMCIRLYIYILVQNNIVCFSTAFPAIYTFILRRITFTKCSQYLTKHSFAHSVFEREKRKESKTEIIVFKFLLQFFLLTHILYTFPHISNMNMMVDLTPTRAHIYSRNNLPTAYV